MRKKRLLFSPILLLFYSLTWANTATISHFTLKNGLEVYLKENHRAPLVISQVWYQVGSANEPLGSSGLSHFLEHLMFDGTKTYKAGEYNQIVTEMGGVNNASTGRDYTNYYAIVNAKALPKILSMEADRMQNLTINKEKFIKERNVVTEERRMRMGNNPISLFYERFCSLIFTNSPYQNMPIGLMSDIKHLQTKDAMDWYRLWYHPNNAKLILVGDFDSKNVAALIRKDFSKIPRSNLPQLKHRPIVLPKGRRYMEYVDARAKVPVMIFGFIVPSLVSIKNAWQPYALSLMADELAGDQDSWLAKVLVKEKKLAANVDVSYQPMSSYETAMMFFITLAPGVKPSQVYQAFQKALNSSDKVLKNPQILERIKTSFLANHIFEQDSLVNQANEIGSAVVRGLPYNFSQKLSSHVEAVTNKQLEQVKKSYFDWSKVTIGLLRNKNIQGLL